jgi:hypothetical protein
MFEQDHAPSTAAPSFSPGGASLWRPLLRAGAFAAAALFGYRAYQIVYNNTTGYDPAFAWYGLALVLLGFAAWDGARPNVATWPSRFLRYAAIDALLVAALVALAALVRLWYFGTLPPDDFVCCEEIINASISHNILDGGRPLNYPLVRFTTAAGLWAFGSNTDGLRLGFVFFGLAAIVPFYLLMRELAARPAALFATALFAAAHALGDVSFHFQPGVFVSVLFAYTVVRGLKTARPLWWLVVGVLAALLSYEYEAFKAVPIAAAAFVLAALVWSLFWPPATIAAMGRRAADLVRRAWLSALVFGLAAAIAASPIMARAHHGEHIYTGSLERQQAGRTATGLARYLSPNWEQQLEWVTQIYSPFLERDFPSAGAVDARGVVDRWTSLLIWAGVLAGAISFWRPWRLWFLGWFVGGSAGLALLVQDFETWKAVGFLPPAIVLVGLLVDDLWRWLQRWRPTLVTRPFAATLALAAAVVLVANFLIIRGNASDPGVLRAYATGDAELLASCRYLQTRPEDNFSYLALWSLGGSGFLQPRDSADAERKAWRNNYFACRGLDGAPAPSGEEVWPFTAPPEDRALTLLLTGSPRDVERWQRALERALPRLGEPAFVRPGPADVVRLVGYELEPDRLASWHGLYATFDGTGGQYQQELVGPADLMPSALPEGASVRITGVVYAPPSASDRALAVAGAEGTVRVNGREVYARSGGEERVTPLPLAEGWHLVEMELRATIRGAAAKLEWRGAGGTATPVQRDEAFPLTSAKGWMHTRVFLRDDGLETLRTRFDFEPHVARLEVVRAAVQPAVPGDPDASLAWSVAEDRWSAVWHVDRPAHYRLVAISVGSDIELFMDGVALTGEAVGVPEGGQSSITYELDVDAGDHLIELRYRLVAGVLVGGGLEFRTERGNEIAPDVSPYMP